MVKWSDHGSTTSFIFCSHDITHSVAFILRTRSYLDFLVSITDIVVHTYLLCLMSVPINLVSCCGHWQSLIHYDLINANSTFPDKYIAVTNRSPRQPLEKRSFQFYNESMDKRVSALRFAYESIAFFEISFCGCNSHTDWPCASRSKACIPRVYYR